MIFGLGTGRVAGGQKVADNKKPTDPRKSFTVAWEKRTAKIADVVGIKGSAHIQITDQSRVTVSILHDKKYYAGAQSVQVKKNGEITAVWKVSPTKMGDFTKGVYDVEISYGGGLSGQTSAGLQIVKPGKSGDGFDG